MNDTEWKRPSILDPTTRNPRIVIDISIECSSTSHVYLAQDLRQMSRHIGHLRTGKDWKTANLEKNVFLVQLDFV
jgi:hypothetical protein